jgi:hypothetical protein
MNKLLKEHLLDNNQKLRSKRKKIQGRSQDRFQDQNPRKKLTITKKIAKITTEAITAATIIITIKRTIASIKTTTVITATTIIKIGMTIELNKVITIIEVKITKEKIKEKDKEDTIKTMIETRTRAIIKITLQKKNLNQGHDQYQKVQLRRKEKFLLQKQ